MAYFFDYEDIDEMVKQLLEVKEIISKANGTTIL